LQGRLSDLHARVHEGRYHAAPVRRRWLDKPDGGRRALGIATIEDKVVQQAVVSVLEAIYEPQFKGFSYGFRPGRGQHDALDALWVGLTETPVNWVLDLDIRGYFGAPGDRQEVGGASPLQ
jgi:retron-type reverse transcriptase